MTRTKSENPIDRTGVFARIGEVPDRHRLRSYADVYDGRDVWATFCEESEYQRSDADRYRGRVDRVGGYWLEHMADQGRHHALAAPRHVERWAEHLLAEHSSRTALGYWTRIHRFYDWLRWHTDHPHVYDPTLLAIIEGSASERIWEVKLERWERAREQYTPVDERGSDDA
jgi:hypothetical protein